MIYKIRAAIEAETEANGPDRGASGAGSQVRAERNKKPTGNLRPISGHTWPIGPDSHVNGPKSRPTVRPPKTKTFCRATVLACGFVKLFGR